MTVYIVCEYPDSVEDNLHRIVMVTRDLMRAEARVKECPILYFIEEHEVEG